MTDDDVTKDAETIDEKTADDSAAEDSAADDKAAATAVQDDDTAISGVDGTATPIDDGPDDPDEYVAEDGLVRHLLVPVLLVLLVFASAGLTAWLYFGEYRQDQSVGAAAKTQAIQSASDGTVALLSYSPDTLDKDFATAKTHLTGDFLNYYTQFTAEIVTPAAKQKSVKTSAAVVRSALVQLQPTTAEVLLFINQTTTSKENPAGSFTASSVKVGLLKVGDGWLISKFDPV